jgi:hypothetical protein
MKTLHILDFDIENRPLAYLGQDFTTAEVTAIAAGFLGSKRVFCWLLGQDTAQEMLEGFREMYDRAHMVTGHFIRKHDLPILNGAFIELGLEPLAPKLVSDTCLDLIKTGGISKSQENLSEMLHIADAKQHMSNATWREANRLTGYGLAKTRRRVVGDVRQNMALRARLVRRDLLKPPKLWRP